MLQLGSQRDRNYRTFCRDWWNLLSNPCLQQRKTWIWGVPEPILPIVPGYHPKDLYCSSVGLAQHEFSILQIPTLPTNPFPSHWWYPWNQTISSVWVEKNLWWLILLFLMNFFQCQTIEMIIVIVRNYDQVDVGQVLGRNSGFHKPFRSGKTDGRCPLCHMRVGQNIEPIELQKQGWVTDPGQSRFYSIVF